MATLQIIIRKGKVDDLTTLQNLFVDTVQAVCKNDYSDQQIKAWTSSVENQERWFDLVTKQFLLVAQDREKIIGFCSLQGKNYIDLLYVHKDYQGQGIAAKLYNDIEREAIKKGAKQLTSDVSITAKPFFEKAGFKLVTKQTVIRQEIELTNFRMLKKLE